MKTKLLKGLTILLTASMLVVSASFVSSALGSGDTGASGTSATSGSGKTGAPVIYSTSNPGGLGLGTNTRSIAPATSNLVASGSSVELDGTNDETVTVSLVATEAITCYGIEGTWDTTEQGDSGHLKLTGLSFGELGTDSLDYVDVETGKVMWTDLTFNAGTISANAKLLTATYKVAADTPDGEYTVNFVREVFTGEDGEPDETGAVFAATITVTHKSATTGLKGDIDLDEDVDSDDLTLLARHVGGMGFISDATALLNADVNEDGLINSDDLTKHARYVGGIITDWSQE